MGDTFKILFFKYRFDIAIVGLLIAGFLIGVILIGYLCLTHYFSKNGFPELSKFLRSSPASSQFSRSTPEFSRVLPSGYVVNQENCKIIDIDINEHWSFKGKDNVVRCGTRGQLVLQNDTHIFLNEGALKNYDIESKEDVDCIYNYFWRIPAKRKYDRIHHGIGAKLENDGTKMEKEFVRVNCTYLTDYGLTLSYTDYYAFIPVLSSKISENRSKSSKYNVLIVGIDAASRLNFHRNMPKTYDFISRSLSAVEFFGFTKVGHNTYPNLIPVLTGLNVPELEKTCCPEKNSTFDNCSFIWNDYHDAGYITAFAEEGAWMGLVDGWGRRGFYQQPVDHMWTKLEGIAAKHIGKQGKFARKCLGEKLNVKLILENSRRFLKSYRSINRNYFSMVWTCSMTHDDMNYGTEFDQIFLKYFKDLNAIGVLEDTIVFFMADHGLNIGDYLNTYTGRLENRLPLFIILTPNSFKSTNPEAFSNLVTNTRRLTTPFDLYDTLKAIVIEDFSNSPVFKRGISLFKPIPSNRSCESAGVMPHFCTCLGKLFPVKLLSVQLAVKVVIIEINRLIENETACIKVSLNKIIDATGTSHTDGTNHITVVFRSEICGAVFEATVSCKNCEDENSFELAGPINRNDIYIDLSRCIPEGSLKPYCCCNHNFYVFP